MEEKKLLESWKDIAAYLNRSVVTCHRWEGDLGLPVHRLDGTPKARVFAYTDEIDRWKAEKLHHRDILSVAEAQNTEAHKSKKWIWLAAGAIIGATILAILTWKFLLHPSISAPAQVPTLGVLTFENKTGDPAWDAWKKALPLLITSDLRQSKLLDPMRRSYFENAIGPLANAERFSPEDLKKVAERAEVNYVLTGTLTKSGDDIIINTILHDAGAGEVIASPRAKCRKEKDIFSGVDRLSKAVKAGLKFTARQIRGDIDRPVARIMTKSPEAFLIYSQAYLIQGKMVQGRVKWDEAIAPLQKVVEIDPEFGMAHDLLFRAYMSTSRKEDAKKTGEIAVRLAHRFGKRDRGYFLNAYYTTPDWRATAKSIEALQRLGKDYPFDPYLGQLSIFFMNREEWEKAIPILDKLLSHKRNRWVIQDLARCYQSIGLYSEAEKLLDEVLAGNPKPDSGLADSIEGRLALARVQGKSDEAHGFADRLMAIFPIGSRGILLKAFIYFMQDDFANAEKTFQRLTESDKKSTQASGFQRLAAVSLSRGRIEEAKERIRRALELDKSVEGAPRYTEGNHHLFLAYLERLSGRLPEALKEAELACGSPEGAPLAFVQGMYLRALITLEMNLIEEFEKQAEEIKKYLNPGRSPEVAPRFMRLYYNLMGHRELQKANYDQAIRYFWKALDLLSVLSGRNVDGDHAKYFFDLAEAYRRRSGGLPTGIAQYEMAVLPSVSREFSGDLYAKSYYWLGIYWERTIGNTGIPGEARDRRLKAIGFYRKFLSLWEDADPIFPEVPDAKARQARLEAQEGITPSR